jgi:hypothetical protein
MDKDLHDFVRGVIHRYVENRCHPGSGFQRMIIADLNPSFLDKELRANLVEVLEMIQREVPAEARGSEEAFRKWIGGNP